MVLLGEDVAQRHGAVDIGARAGLCDVSLEDAEKLQSRELLLPRQRRPVSPGTPQTARPAEGASARIRCERAAPRKARCAAAKYPDVMRRLIKDHWWWWRWWLRHSWAAIQWGMTAAQFVEPFGVHVSVQVLLVGFDRVRPPSLRMWVLEGVRVVV